MPDEQPFPESLPLSERSAGIPIISQLDLRHHSMIERAAMSSRAKIMARVMEGATVESGNFNIDPDELERPMSPIVWRKDNARSEAQESFPSSKAEEPDPDGGLTYSEQAMLRSFAVRGDFQPAVLHSIVDRFAQLRSARFAAEYERMWSTGCFEVGSWFVKMATFEVHLRRVKASIWLYEAGYTRYRGCIIEGIHSLNRGYFRAV